MISRLRVGVSQTALPGVGQTASADIGSSIIGITQTDAMLTHITINRDLPFQLKWFGMGFDTAVPKGVYDLVSYDGTWASFQVQAQEYRASGSKREIAKFARPVLQIRYNPETGQLVGLEKQEGAGTLSAKPFPVPASASDFVVERCVTAGKVRFRRELIYSGVNQGSLHLIYREFADDLIRPAFSQDIYYNLADGDEIGFKGARFKVERATNTQITYSVLSPLQ